MKQVNFLTLAITTLISTSALADINASNGFYLGGEIGGVDYDAVHGQSLSSSIGDIIPVAKLFARPFIGYRVSDYFAVEGGYTDIKDSESKGDSYWGPDHYRLYSFDLAAKGIMPFSNGFSLFGKIGVALTHQDVFNQMFTDSPSSVTANTNSNQLQPLLGVGVSYNFTQHIATDLSVTQQFRSGKIGRIAMAGLGIAYTF